MKSDRLGSILQVNLILVGFNFLTQFYQIFSFEYQTVYKTIN